MIVKYKNKILKHSLIFGLIWTVLGTASIFLNNSNWGYGFILLGLIYLISYAYQKHYH